MKFVVAIDGPAAAGKGTISKAVATHFGFQHLDTGLLYRAVGKKALDLNTDISNEDNVEKLANDLSVEDLNAEGLRNSEVAQAASKIAAIPKVRNALVDFQREFATRDGGAVLDGRDIGSVICPDADIKIFVTASAEIRAERRYKELSEKGHDVTPETVLTDVKARDARDADRATAPMVMASDAVLIDTSDMDIEMAVATAIKEVATVFDKTRQLACVLLLSGSQNGSAATVAVVSMPSPLTFKTVPTEIPALMCPKASDLPKRWE